MRPRLRSPARVRSALLLGAALGAGCAGPAEFVRRPPTPLAWPAPEALPRVDFEFAYAGSADVVRHPGFFGWLASVAIGDEEVQMVSPAGTATAGDILWIADPGANCVHRVSLVSGEHAIATGLADSPFTTPIAIAALPDGSVAVTDAANARITVLAADGTAVRAFGGPTQIERPTGICFDPQRQRLLVVDTVACKLLAFDVDGNLLASKGGRGTAPGEFNYPTHIARTADGRIVVVDSLNFRVQVLSPDLEPLAAFGRVGRGPGDFANPKGIAVDSRDNLYVVDSMFDNFQIFDLSGQLLLAVGTSGNDLGQCYLPTAIHIDGADRIVLSDAGNSRIQILQIRHAAP